MATARLGVITGWVFVVCYLLNCLYLGFLNGQTALTDPDTCWLVAVGNQINASGFIPSADPFSWTLGMHPQPYIAYQWLSAAFLSSLYKAGGASTLVYFSALLICAAFLVVPIVATRVLPLSLPVVACLSLLTLAAASFHFPCRPEIFSYFLLAVVNLAVVKILDSKSSLPLYLYSFSGLCFFSLWANLHTGFIIGLIILTTTGLLCRDHRILAALAGGVLGSLLNPYGLRLWQYLPHLFFSAANKYNFELMPLRSFELRTFEYWPFDLIIFLIFLGWGLEVKAWIGRGRSTEKNAHFSLSNISWLLLSSSALALSLQCRRLIPFAVLIVMGALYQLLVQRKQQWPLFIQDLAEAPQTLLRVSRNLVLILPLVLTGIGVNLALSVFPAALPSNTPGFAPPLAALQLIGKSRPQGRILNDPQFGDMILLKQGKAAQVFIDTRFDVYGDQLVLDYWHMANCRGNWQELLKQYQIDWIFFPRQAPLTHKLARDPGWQVIQEDDTATIIVKKVAP